MSSPNTPATVGPPTVQAHRSFAGVAPENTVLAARLATERFDADWIEVDVRPTADGVVVCFHDPALGEAEGSRAIADGTGLVRDRPAEEVCATEVLDSGETIPRLSAFLAAVPAEVGLNVELKSPGGPGEDDWLLDDNRAEQQALWDEFVPDVVDLVAADDSPVVFTSFFEGAIAAAAEHAPEIPRAVVVGADLEVGRTIADRHDADAINARASLLLEVGSPFVDRAHDEGLAVNAWTVSEWTEYRDLAAIGVDGVIADYPFLDAAL